jgi:glycosyltransferase involved in cell wall biosynthesis
LISEFAAAWNLDADSLAMEVHACEYHPTPSAECERAKVELGFPGQRIALMLGFLRPDKNAHLLLRSADSVLSRIPDLHYVIAGEPRGPYGQSYAQSLYEQLAGVKHPHRIRLHPFYLSDTALDQYFTAADAVIVPYDKAPGASGPIHHALGRGKAVIAAAVGQNLGLSGTISLFPRGDHAALADSLLAMFLNEEMLVRAKARATRYAEAHTWELLAESYVRQYEELMGCACPREVRAP